MRWLFLFFILSHVSIQTFGQDINNDEFKEKVVQTQKAIWLCHVLRKKVSENYISELDFIHTKVPVFMMPVGENMRPLVKLQLKFDKPGWELFVGEKIPVQKTEDPKVFFVYAYLNSRVSQVFLEARNSDGDKIQETVFLFAPEAREYQMSSPFNTLIFKLGYGNLIYEQTSYGVFNGKSLLIGANYISPETGKKLGFLGDFQISFFSFDSEPEDYNPQYYEADLLLTYSVPLFKSPLIRSRIYGGVSTVGMYSHGSPFGFSNLYGPSFGIRSEYYVDKDRSYSGDLSYVSYDKISIDQDRAFKLKLSWNYNLSTQRKFVFSLNYSNHSFVSGFEFVEAEFWATSAGLSF
jgi:hypothetical protein